MRISTSYQYSAFQSNIDSAGQALFKIQQEISSGKRINTPSDDPFGTTQVMQSTELQAGLTQYMANLNTAQGSLTFTDQALSNTSTLATQAYQYAVSGANAATDQQSRDAMAQEVATLQQQLVQLANSQGPSGQYLFAGQQNATAPFAVNGNTLSYSGDGNDVIVQTSPTDTMVVNTQGQAMYTDLYNQLESLKNDLQGGNSGALSDTDISALQGSINTVNSARGEVGAKLQLVTNLTSQYQTRSDQLTTSISNVQDVNMAQAISDYGSASLAYQAALSVATQGFKMSILNFIQ